MKTNILRATIIYPVRGDEVLMSVKQRKVNAGKICGYGGTIEHGDASPEMRALKELEEECGLRAFKSHLIPQAVITFSENGNPLIFKVKFWVIKHWTGTPIDTDEMKEPHFYYIWRLPPNMPVGDHLYLRDILCGQRLVGEIHFSKGKKRVLRSHFHAVSGQQLRF